MKILTKRKLNYVFCVGMIALSTQMLSGKEYYLKDSEAGSGLGCWSNPTHWYDGVEKTDKWVVTGNPATEFSSEDDFIVPPLSSGYTLRESGGSTTVWNGKSLQLGGEIKNANSNLAVLRLTTRGEGSSITFENDGLILATRSKVMPYYSNSRYNINGIVTVTSTDEKYSALIKQREYSESDNTTFNNMSLFLNDKFKSAAEACARVYSTAPGFSITFDDTTEYYGKLTVSNDLEHSASTTINLASHFPGTLSISTNVTVVPASGVKITNLVYFDGAIIDARSGTLEITGSITHTGKIRVLVDGFGADSMTPRFSELVKVSADSEITVDDFEFITSSGESLDCDDYSLVTENGVATIKAVRYGYVTLTSSDNTSRTKVNPSSMTNEQHWSDGLLPTNPLIRYGAIGNNLRTYDSGPLNAPLDDFVFNGQSLIIDDSILVAINRSFRCNNLVLRNGGTYAPSPYYHGTVYGKITADSGDAKFSVYSYKTNTIQSVIEGNGNVVFTAPSGASSSDPRGYHILKGRNEGFAGTMTVTMPRYVPADPIANRNKITPRFDRNYTVLSLTDKLNLGGTLPAVNRKAFTIENMSRVQPEASVESLVLDEPTRGIFIKWVGRLNAEEGQTLTVASPLAVHGTLWKEGAGTLVLANPAPTFGADANGEMPDGDATNRTFIVAGGSLEIASVDAINGLDVVFTNGAENIVINLGSDNELFTNYGIRNTKSSTPFALEGDLVKIPVVLDLDEQPTAPVTHALLTVKSACLDSVLSCIAFVKGEAIAGWPMSMSRRDNGDGTTTLMATVKKYGTRIVIK
jgi:hypothetical protein